MGHELRESGLAYDAQLRQAVRFVLVGILNTIVGYGAFFILLNYFDYLAALLVSYGVGILHSFLWNKYWTFRSGGVRIAEFLKFNSVYVLSLVVNAAALAALVEVLRLDPKLGQLLLLPVTTLISYLGHKYWSFR